MTDGRPEPIRQIVVPICHPWSELMDAEEAARYLGERSARAFRRRVGTVYPKPFHVPGRGDVWRKRDLDRYIHSLGDTVRSFDDIADVLS